MEELKVTKFLLFWICQKHTQRGQRIIRIAKNFNCEIKYAIGDAGYCCPKTIERLVLSGIDFMTRANPRYSIFNDIIEKNIKDIDDKKYAVRYKNRFINIIKIKTKIAFDAIEKKI